MSDVSRNQDVTRCLKFIDASVHGKQTPDKCFPATRRNGGSRGEVKRNNRVGYVEDAGRQDRVASRTGRPTAGRSGYACRALAATSRKEARVAPRTHQRAFRPLRQRASATLAVDLADPAVR